MAGDTNGVRPIGSGAIDAVGPPAPALADAAAFEVAFEQHFDPVFRYLRARAGRQLAEDLAGDTFARAYSLRARFDGEASQVRPWLFGIATNVLREYRRSERRRLRAYARSAPDQPVLLEVDDLAARLDAMARGRDLAGLLASLRPGDRDLLLLTAIGNLTTIEAAEALGIPAGTAASRLSRLRTRLQPLLEENERR